MSNQKIEDERPKKKSKAESANKPPKDVSTPTGNLDAQLSSEMEEELHDKVANKQAANPELTALYKKLDQLREKQRKDENDLNMFIPNSISKLTKELEGLKKKHLDDTSEFEVMEESNKDYAKTKDSIEKQKLQITSLESHLTTANQKLEDKKRELAKDNIEVIKLQDDIQDKIKATKKDVVFQKLAPAVILKQEKFEPSILEVIDFNKKKINREMDSPLQQAWQSAPVKAEMNEKKKVVDHNFMETLSEKKVAEAMGFKVKNTNSDSVELVGQVKDKKDGSLIDASIKVTKKEVTSNSDNHAVLDKQVDTFAKLLIEQGRLETAEIAASGPQKEYLLKRFEEVKKNYLNAQNTPESKINVSDKKSSVLGTVGSKQEPLIEDPPKPKGP